MPEHRGPYAPPLAAVVAEPDLLLGEREPHGVFPPVPGRVLSEAWRATRRELWPLTLGAVALTAAVLVCTLPLTLLQLALQAAMEQSQGQELVVVLALGSLAIQGVGAVVNTVAQGYAVLGLAQACLRAAREEPVAVGDFFPVPGRGAGRWIGAAAVCQLLFSLAVTAGLCALVLPAVVIGGNLALWPHVLLDQGGGPLEALRGAWGLGSGVRTELALWSLLCVVGIGLGSLLTGGLGFFPLTVWFGVGLAKIYLGARDHRWRLR